MLNSTVFPNSIIIGSESLDPDKRSVLLHFGHMAQWESKGHDELASEEPLAALTDNVPLLVPLREASSACAMPLL